MSAVADVLLAELYPLLDLGQRHLVGLPAELGLLPLQPVHLHCALVAPASPGSCQWNLWLHLRGDGGLLHLGHGVLLLHAGHGPLVPGLGPGALDVDGLHQAGHLDLAPVPMLLLGVPHHHHSRS